MANSSWTAARCWSSSKSSRPPTTTHSWSAPVVDVINVINNKIMIIIIVGSSREKLPTTIHSWSAPGNSQCCCCCCCHRHCHRKISYTLTIKILLIITHIIWGYVWETRASIVEQCSLVVWVLYKLVISLCVEPLPQQETILLVVLVVC